MPYVTTNYGSLLDLNEFFFLIFKYITLYLHQTFTNCVYNDLDRIIAYNITIKNKTDVTINAGYGLGLGLLFISALLPY